MKIVDLSNNNQTPDFHAMKRAGVGAVWLKASEGTTFKDSTFAARRRQANAAGLRVGAYHFARPDENADAILEAHHFAECVDKLARTDLRPVLDYERTRPSGDDESWIHSFNKATRRYLGAGPIFYTYPGLLPQLRLSEPVGYGLWLASYGPDDGRRHPVRVPSPWKSIVAHQYTQKGTVAGCHGFVDLTAAPKLRSILAHPIVGLVA